MNTEHHSFSTLALHTKPPEESWAGGHQRHLAPPITVSATFELPTGLLFCLNPCHYKSDRRGDTGWASVWEIWSPQQMSPGAEPGQSGVLQPLSGVQLWHGCSPCSAADPHPWRPYCGWNLSLWWCSESDQVFGMDFCPLLKLFYQTNEGCWCSCDFCINFKFREHQQCCEAKYEVDLAGGLLQSQPSVTWHQEYCCWVTLILNGLLWSIK